MRARRANAPSRRVHRSGACTRGVTQRRLRAMDLRQRLARFIEALDRAFRGTAGTFPRKKEQHGCDEQTDTADEEQQSGEGTHSGMLTMWQVRLNCWQRTSVQSSRD
jgi:hypothetical protein